jgi:hypothetical protein
MESPTLLPASDSVTKEEEEKVQVVEAANSIKERESLEEVRILESANTADTSASGSTNISTTKALPSETKSPLSSKTDDGDPPPSTTVDVVDSALLAALRDPRERLGLLKLEQNLIDFLEKQPQDQYVDIGGPYNSTVISPTLGYIGQQPQQLQAMAQPQADGTNAGRPQTTFQRCILHRICDRFNMTRENSYVTDAYGCYLIRVKRGPDSKKPLRRLLNVKESEYQIPRPSTENTTVNGGSKPSFQLSSNFQQMSISSTSSTNPVGVMVGSNSMSTKGGAKVRKMKIMKRSSSNVSNSSSGSNNSKAKNNVAVIKARSSLSEKEKKYAEARARIFEQEEGRCSGNGDQPAVSSYNNDSGTTGVSVPMNNNWGPQGNNYNNNNNNKSSMNNDSHGGYPYSERRGSYNNNYSYNLNRQSPQAPPISSQAAGAATGNTKAPMHTNSTTSLNSMASNNSGKGSNSDGDQQQSATTRSKATYRNRQQEETDPDFRRGTGIQLQANPYAHTHTAVGYGTTGGGRGTGNVYYPNNVVAGNSNNRAGYGYAQQQQQQQQQQQHYQYHHHHLQQQHYSAQQQHQAQYYPSTNPVGGRGYTHSSLQYQQQRRQQEQHYPALSSSTTRK